MTDKIKIQPLRSDSHYMKDVLNAALNARIGLIVVSIIAFALVICLLKVLSKPQRVVVVDTYTGKTFVSTSHIGISEDVLERQLCYYSAQACEDFFNLDYLSINLSRERFVELAHPELRIPVRDTPVISNAWVNDYEAQKAKTDKAQSYFSWEINPKVTMKSDPYYKVFNSFQRIVKVNESIVDVRKFNVIVIFGRLRKNVDYTKRPHSLVITSFKIITGDSPEYKDQLKTFQ